MSERQQPDGSDDPLDSYFVTSTYKPQGAASSSATPKAEAPDPSKGPLDEDALRDEEARKFLSRVTTKAKGQPFLSPFTAKARERPCGLRGAILTVTLLVGVASLLAVGLNAMKHIPGRRTPSSAVKVGDSMRILLGNRTLDVMVTAVDRGETTVVVTSPERMAGTQIRLTADALLKAEESYRQPHPKTLEEIEEEYERKRHLINLKAEMTKACILEAATHAYKTGTPMSPYVGEDCERKAVEEIRKRYPDMQR